MIAIAISCNPTLLDRRRADHRARRHRAGGQCSISWTSCGCEHNMAMIMISHNMGVVAETADDILVMYAGQVVEQAP